MVLPKNNIASYILAMGIVVCALATNTSAIDRSLVARHIAWGVLTLILCGFLFLRRTNRSVMDSTIFIAFLGYCILTTISVFKAVNKSESLYFILVSWVSLLFFVCVASLADKKIVVRTLVYLGLIFSLVGLYDLFFAGLNPGGVRSTYGVGFAYCLNLWASTLLLLLPFSLYAAIKKSKVAAVTVELLIINMIFLQTRSVYLGLIAASIIVLLYYKKRLIIPACLVVIVCVCVFPRLRDTSSFGYRLTTWNRTIKTITDDPIFGVGAGNWKIANSYHGDFVVTPAGEIKQQRHQRTHNDFLEILSEIGIVGGVCYALIFIIALAYASRAKDKAFAWCMCIGIIFYTMFALFDFPKERAVHTILIFTMIGLIVREYPRRRIWKDRNLKAFGFCVVIIGLSLFVNHQRLKSEIYCQKSLLAQARGELQKSIDIINDNYSPFATMLGHAVTPILYYKGVANYHLHNDKEALADFYEANRLHPNHPAILTNIGAYKLIQKDYPEAEKYLTRANRIYPDTEFIEKMLAIAERNNHGNN